MTRPDAVTLLAEALSCDWSLAWRTYPGEPDPSETYARWDHSALAGLMLTHPPLAAALETDRLAREWWEGVVSGDNVGNLGGRPFNALTDHLRATAAGGDR